MSLELVNSASLNGEVAKVYGTDNSACAFVMEGHTGGVLSADFSSTGMLFNYVCCIIPR